MKDKRMNCIVCGKPDIVPSDDKVEWMAHDLCYLRVRGKVECDALYKKKGKEKKYRNPLKKK